MGGTFRLREGGWTRQFTKEKNGKNQKESIRGGRRNGSRVWAFPSLRGAGRWKGNRGCNLEKQKGRRNFIFELRWGGKVQYKRSSREEVFSNSHLRGRGQGEKSCKKFRAKKKDLRGIPGSRQEGRGIPHLPGDPQFWKEGGLGEDVDSARVISMVQKRERGETITCQRIPFLMGKEGVIGGGVSGKGREEHENTPSTSGIC